MKPIQRLALGYFAVCIIGFLLLCLPVFHQTDIHWIDHLFIAVSAVSTTGLTPLALGDSYHFGGQFIILILIQIGGVGYMSIAAFSLLLIHHKWRPEETALMKNDLGLPPHYNLFDLIKIKIFIALLFESLGAIFLFIFFKHAGVEEPLWNAIFHSISAFCTAGMSLFANNLENFPFHYGINLTIALLCYSGAIGFIVFADLWQRIKGKRKQLTFTSFVILKMTTLGIVCCTLLFFFTEPSIQNFAFGERCLTSFFHVISAGSTAGFNTLNFAHLSMGNLFLLALLMLVGASPTGTGGGVKITTMTIVIAQMVSSFRGLSKTIWKQSILPVYRVRMASASFTLYVLLLVLSSLWLTYLVPEADFEAVLFEAISAFSTVGLTMGLTYELHDIGKLLLTAIMFVGRIGLLSLGAIIFIKHRQLKTLRTQDISI